MAQVLGKDGQESSASQAWRDALADADHLAVLHAIWTAETSPARDQRYRQLLTAALPPGHEYEPGHREKWLWWTLRAELLHWLLAWTAKWCQGGSRPWAPFVVPTAGGARSAEGMGHATG